LEFSRLIQAQPILLQSGVRFWTGYWRLVAAASRANELGQGEQLTVQTNDGKYTASLTSKLVGDVHSEGRTLLEAIAHANWEMKLLIDCVIS